MQKFFSIFDIMFRISKNFYDAFTQYDIFDTESNLIFFRFQESHRDYLTDMQIQCTTEWEEYKELLPEIFLCLEELKDYDYSILLKAIREVKLTNLGIL